MLNDTCFRVRKCYGRRALVDISGPCDASALWHAFAVIPVDVKADVIASIAGVPWFVSGPNGVWASNAWEKGVTGSDNIIAVLDTGLWPDSIAPGYVERVVDGYDFCSSDVGCDDGDGRDSDYSEGYAGHGTTVTLAATAVAKNVTVMPIRMIGDGHSSGSDMADSIVYAAGGQIDGLQSVTRPATVISISANGVGKCPDWVQSAIDLATQKGIPVFVAAGNNDGVPSTAFWPCNCKGTITVGASDPSGELAFFSNTHFDIAAPGIITVTMPNGSGGSASKQVMGTSFSTPIAAAAFMLAMSPVMFGKDFVLEPTTQEWNYAQRPDCIGRGIVSLRGNPTAMQPCSVCGNIVSIAMHYIEDGATRTSAIEWIVLLFCIAVLFWAFCMLSWRRGDQLILYAQETSCVQSEKTRNLWRMP